ncbi:MAG: Fpg/Nei family DNA glycosylase [Candidatus Dormibacteria bacterium]
MPELPEVEALVRALAGRMSGEAIADVTVHNIATLKTYDPPLRALRGRAVQGCARQGKFVDILAPPLHLVIHLSRAGWLHWHDRLPQRRPSMRGRLALQFRLESGSGFEATEQGTEKRLAVYLVRSPEDVPGIAHLGVDVMDRRLDVASFSQLLRETGATLKRTLGDQAVIAGIGNAYSDEILHAARLSPFQRASALTDGELARLHATIGEVLGAAVEREAGLEPGALKPDKRAHLRVHGRTGEACPVCSSTIREVSYSSRSFQYCPGCQTEGRVLADRRMSRLLR